MTPDLTWKPNLGKPPMQLVTVFHSSEVSPVRSQPCQRLQNTLLGVTLLEDLITLLGVALLEVFRTIQMNCHLVRGFAKWLLNQLC